jgi:hypothetical protein
MELYLHSLICLHSMVLNYLSIGTNSPLSGEIRELSVLATEYEAGWASEAV